jgi:hypothetical protein
VIPPDGAIPLSVTTPVDGVPPFTEAGLTEIAERLGEATVSVAVLVPLYVAEIVTETLIGTGVVTIENVAEVAPCGTVTLAGRVVEGSLLVSTITAPFTPAVPFRVAVPVADDPPVKVLELRETAETAKGPTVNAALFTAV